MPQAEFSSSPGWPPAVVQVTLKLPILPEHAECWDYTHAPLQPALYLHFADEESQDIESVGKFFTATPAPQSTMTTAEERTPSNG